MLNSYGARALPMMGLGGYDGGGKVEELAKGVYATPTMRAGATVGAIASGADGDSVVDFSDPFGGMIDRFTKGLRERFDAGKFIDIGIGIVKKLVNGAKNFVGDKLAGGWENIKGVASDVKNAVGGFAHKGIGFARAAQAAASLGLRVTSGYRPGARTAGSGVVSLHAQNRARDFAGSPAAMREFFNRMDRPPYPTELLHTPMGSRNIHRSGRRYANTGATARNHYDHVHVGYHRGGLVPVDHMRFMGGPVETWGNTLVGEFGPEMFFPTNGGPASLVGLNGPEVLSFNQEGAIAPHKAVAALDAYNDRMSTENHSEHNENSHYDVKVTVGGSATETDIEGAVTRAIEKAERKKRERR